MWSETGTLRYTFGEKSKSIKRKTENGPEAIRTTTMNSARGISRMFRRTKINVSSIMMYIF